MASRELIVSFGKTDGEPSFRSIGAPDFTLDALASVLRVTRLAEAAFVKDAARLPRQDIDADTGPIIDVIGSLRVAQGYLDAAPGGVQISALTGVPGATGAGVRVFDAEEDWQEHHIDRPVNFLGRVFGPVSPAVGANQHHGTAVMGVIAARDDSVGVIGIAPDVSFGLVRFKPNYADSHGTIRGVVDTFPLKAGDILVLPIDRMGPRGKHIPIEWWPDDFGAIKHATDQGVIVVEAAGNGGENLDDSFYGTARTGMGFVTGNPFAIGGPDSGAILVGAGVPPGRFTPSLSRHADSNHGSRVDAQGWGEGITTTGYGDRNRGFDSTRFYAANFGRTSGSTAMIAGVLACAQGARIAAGKLPWTPAEARAALRATGSVQQPSATRPVTERIGNRPNLAQLIPRALL